MSKFKELRNEYPEFIYESFSSEICGKDLGLKFRFVQNENIIFEPELIFKNCIPLKFSVTYLNTVFFNIGMIELISYYKACCSPNIIIKAGSLSEEQINFWSNIYFNGLGEFLYTNRIKTSPNELFRISCTKDAPEHLPSNIHLNRTGIIPVGGGKDSVVTLELLSELNYLPLILNPRKASIDSVKNARYPGFFEITRRIDPLLIELNKKGFLNGHTPFSALLAFVSSAASIINGSRDIVLSNENSASEGNTFFSGIEINHQYSKSFEAELAIHNYIVKFIHEDLNYFSLLRPLNELKIAEIFSRYPYHLKDFRSCNAGSKEDKWCNKCPKCLFTYIILSPFVDPGVLEKAFGKNLLDDRELENIFKELTGISGIKPFECVGTSKEIIASLFKTVSNLAGKELPFLLTVFIEEKDPVTHEKLADFDDILNEYCTENLLNENYRDLVKAAL
jgi:UDP-N-acetyl-alpha-D-muramoyl-L-alanyl-L-glutamate epimerase